MAFSEYMNFNPGAAPHEYPQGPAKSDQDSTVVVCKVIGFMSMAASKKKATTSLTFPSKLNSGQDQICTYTRYI